MLVKTKRFYDDENSDGKAVVQEEDECGMEGDSVTE